MNSESKSFIALIRPVAILGWPMVLTQLFIMATGFVDTAMAGHYSTTDLAGVSLASSIMWPIFFLLTGITTALQPITSQLRGANRLGEVGHQLRQGLWICLATRTIMTILLVNSESLLSLGSIDEQTAFIASEYLKAAAWGVPPVVLYICFRQVSEGLGHTIPPMLIAGGMLPVNALLNYAFIYGKFGLPEMGGIGCGYATAIHFWLELLLMLVVIRRPFFMATNLYSAFEWPDIKTISAIARLGTPIALTIFLEMAVFAVVAFLVANIGVTEMAAHSIAGNLNWMTYVIPMAIGSAASIRIGFLVGEQDFRGAQQTAYAVFKFSIIYAIVVSALLIGFRFQLVSLYTTDEAVIGIAVVLLLFIALYQLADDTQAVIVSSLRGYKDTKVPMIISMLSYWFLGLPLGHSLASGLFGFPELGVFGYWIGLSVGLAVVAVFAGLRLRRISGDWERVRKLSGLSAI